MLKLLELNRRHLRELGPVERLEGHHGIEPVEELRPEVLPHHREHLLLALLEGRREIDEVLRPHVRGEDEDDIAEVDRATLAIGETSVVEHLQQDVEHLVVGLLDLVEQDHRVGPAAHRLGQLPALLVADVAGGSAHEPGDRMLLRVLAHVDAHHRALVVEQELRERLRQLGLADTGRAEEEEGAGRTIRVGDASPGTAHGVAHLSHGLGLPHDPAAELLLHPEQLLGLALEQTAGRDARPTRHHLRDVVGRDLLLDHRAARIRLSRHPSELFFEGRDLGVENPGGLLEVALTLGAIGDRAQVVDEHLDLTDPVEARLLGIPPCAQAAELLVLVGDLGADLLQSLLGGLVGLLGDGELLHPQTVNLTLQDIDLDGRGVDLHAQAARRLVHEVDRLVGEEARGDVAVRERGGGHERCVRDHDLVMRLVLLLDAAKDRDGVLDRGLAHEHLLEPPLERGILLDVLAVLVEGRRPDHAQLAAGKHRLEHVAGIHRTLAARACTDDRVELVDEGDDLAVGLLDLVEHRLQPLLELTAVLRAGDHGGEVE